MRLGDIPWRIRIPLVLTAVIVLTELVVTAALVTRALRDAQVDLETSARTLVTVLGRSLREPLVRDHLWQAFEVITTPLAARSPHNPLLRIVVLDAAHLVFVATEPRLIPVTSAAQELPAILAEMAEVSAQQAGFVFTAQGKGQERALVAAAPVRSEDGTRLGTVILEFDAAVHQARLLRALGEVALVSVPGLLLLIPLGWFAGQRLARPLEQLAQALARVGHEPLNTIASRLPPSGGDEIGRLSVQAQLMLDGLARKEALEREMVASERLAAVGRVAAAIAHEVNNPLGGMLNAIDTVGRHGRPDAFTRKTLGLLERGLLQIRSTVSALLVEARLNSPSIQPTDWEDLRLLVEPQLEAKAARLDWRTDEVADHAVALPAHEVRQLVLNLLLNAAKAAQPWANENAAVELTAARAPGLLAIVVGNTGPPLSAQALSRLFEPFVLPPGPDLASGSGRFGLGLWVCYQIVQRLGGRVDVQSEHGWTRFSVSLPVSDPLLDPRSDVAPTT